jgi:hypothetical protein
MKKQPNTQDCEPINWDKLKEEYFTECSEDSEFTGIKPFKMFKKKPEDVFNWFKSRLSTKVTSPGSDSVMYREVKCSESYPTKETRYFVKSKTGRRTTLQWSKVTEHVWFKEVDIWLEPIPSTSETQPVSVSEEEIEQDFKDWLGWNDNPRPDEDDPDYYTYTWGLNVWSNAVKAYKLSTTQPKIDEEELKKLIEKKAYAAMDDFDGTYSVEISLKACKLIIAKLLNQDK